MDQGVPGPWDDIHIASDVPEECLNWENPAESPQTSLLCESSLGGSIACLDGLLSNPPHPPNGEASQASQALPSQGTPAASQAAEAKEKKRQCQPPVSHEPHKETPDLAGAPLHVSPWA